jgi:hypothetical protein
VEEVQGVVVAEEGELLGVETVMLKETISRLEKNVQQVRSATGAICFMQIVLFTCKKNSAGTDHMQME